MNIATDTVALLQSGVRFRAYPEGALAETLRRWIGCQRVIYNGKTTEDKCFAAQRRLRIAAGLMGDDLKTPLDRQYAQFKDPELTPWLSDVPSQVLRCAADRWFDAKQRQLKGLAQAPTIRHRGNFNSLRLTNDVFRFIKRIDARTGEVAHDIELGTVKHPVGCLPFKAHQPYVLPKTLTIRHQDGRWYVSFSYAHEPADAQALRTPAELAYELNQLSDDDLRVAIIGIDRNVRDNALMASNGQPFDVPAISQARVERKDKGRQRYQRAFARTQKGSSNRRKMVARIGRSHAYKRNVLNEFAHQTSRALVNLSQVRGFALENLKIASMVRKPKAKQSANGKWLRNGARAKAGLTKSILSSAWGRVGDYLAYKAPRQNKLVMKVPAAYSSQECSHCGHTHPDNRNKDRFLCTACGFTEHADFNASLVIRARGIAMIRSGALEAAPKPKKQVARYKQRRISGPEGSVVPVEADVRRLPDESIPQTQWPVNQEFLVVKSEAPSTALRA